MGVAGSDGVHNLHHLPLNIFVQRGTLEELAFLPVEALLFPRSAQAFEMRATIWRGGAGSYKFGFAGDVSMARFAGNFNGVARFAVELAVAMRVLDEVAVDAMHAFFQVNVF